MDATANRVQTLKSHLALPGAALRPVITYVNGDVSWLISFPRPISDKNEHGKVYYHAIIDPWFGEPVQVFTSLLLEMELGREPSISSHAALCTAIEEIELAAGNKLHSTEEEPAVDAIFILGLAEHCTKKTLRQFSPFTPLFAAPIAASTCASWGHFKTVVKMASVDTSKISWKDGHPGAPLPAWLTAFSPAVTKFNNFGLALISSTGNTEEEFILLAPHGIFSKEPSLKGLGPKMKMLALVAPLKDSYAFGKQSVLGVKDGLQIGQMMGTQYYVRSGDFAGLKYKGMISWTLREVSHDLQWGVDALRNERGTEKIVNIPTLVEVENGASYVMV